MHRLFGIPVFLIAAGLAAAQGPYEPPPRWPVQMPRPTYGDDGHVAALAALLADDDGFVREQAVRDLGETHNTNALPHLTAALGDADANVRCAAVVAAAEIDLRQARPLVLRGLGDSDERVVQAALRAVERGRWGQAAANVESLPGGLSASTQAAALWTLTRLGRPVGQQALTNAIKSRSPLVRLRAAENALSQQNLPGLVELLRAMAENDSPAPRGAAVAALGKFDAAGAMPLIEKAAGDAHPLVRRGAVKALRLAGRKEAIARFLDDPSPAVRIEAVRAAGELRCDDGTKRLLDILWQSGAEDAHLAARDALGAIGGEGVVQAAATVLHQADAANLDERTARNIEAACRLLGALKSPAALDEQAALLAALPIESPVLISVADSLGRIGDERSLDPLLGLLNRAVQRGKANLSARQATSPRAIPPYNDDVPAAAVEALAALGGDRAVDAILAAATVRVQLGRLYAPTAAAMRVLPGLAGESRRDAVERCILDVLADGTLDWVLLDAGVISTARVEAARAAVTMKMSSAVDPLRKMADGTPRPIALAAAWAVQQLTGAPPATVGFEVNQGEWIVRRLR